MTTMIPRKRFENEPNPTTLWVRDVLGFCTGMAGLFGIYFFLWILLNPDECGNFLC